MVTMALSGLSTSCICLFALCLHSVVYTQLGIAADKGISLGGALFSWFGWRFHIPQLFPGLELPTG